MNGLGATLAEWWHALVAMVAAPITGGLGVLWVKRTLRRIDDLEKNKADKADIAALIEQMRQDRKEDREDRIKAREEDRERAKVLHKKLDGCIEKINDVAVTVGTLKGRLNGRES